MPDEQPLSRRALRSFLELLALTGLAITQPLLDVFGRAPDRFLVRNADRFDIVLFAVLVALVPALILWAIEWMVWSVSDRGRRIVHEAFLGLLVALLVAQVARRSFDAGGLVLVLVAGAAGVLAVLAYRQWSAVRTGVLYASAATFLYLGAFLFVSPTAELVTAGAVDVPTGVQIDTPRPVVVLQFDEWPLSSIVNSQGEIDADVFPNLAALAADGTWYPNATTVASDTSYALPAIVTGRYPDQEALPVAASYPESLFTLLGDQYEFAVEEPVTQLCPTSLCPRDDINADQGVGALLGDARDAYSVMVSPDPDRRLDPVGVDVAVNPSGMFQGSHFGLVDSPTLQLDAVERTVSSITEGEAPTLHFLHVLLPHQPYRFLPSGQSYEDDLAAFGETDPLGAAATRAEDPGALVPVQQRLILQAQYADQVVGRIVARLKETGLYDDAVVALLADHGVGLQPGMATRRIRPGDTQLYPDLIPVPMIVKAPGLDRDDAATRNVQTIDLVPTIADALGAELPWDVDGVSLYDEGPATDEKRFYVVDVPEGGAGGTALLEDPIELRGRDLVAGVAARNLDTVLRQDNIGYHPYNVSDAGELVGQPVAAIAAGPAMPWQTLVGQPERLADYQPDSGFIPSHLVGAVSGPAPDERATIAVALNGTIAAVVDTFALDEAAHRFEAMLAPNQFVPGANQLALYAVTGTEGARTLHPLPIN